METPGDGWKQRLARVGAGVGLTNRAGAARPAPAAAARPDPASAAFAPAGPVLSPADHQQFIEQGLCIIRGAVPLDVCAAAVEVLEAPERDRPKRDDGMWRQPGAADEGPEARLAQTLTAPILAAVAELFGESNEVEYDPRDSAKLPSIARRSGDFVKGGDFARPRKEQAGDPPVQNHIAHIDDNFPSVMPSGWAVGS